jgi:hypothetical protein
VYISISQVPAIWRYPTPPAQVLSVLGIHHPMLMSSLLDAYPAHTCETRGYDKAASTTYFERSFINYGT